MLQKIDFNSNFPPRGKIYLLRAVHVDHLPTTYTGRDHLHWSRPLRPYMYALDLERSRASQISYQEY